MLLEDNMDCFLPSWIVNTAFMLGSSKQGKERRASGAENCVTAKYLEILLSVMYRLHALPNYGTLLLLDYTVFFIR